MKSEYEVTRVPTTTSCRRIVRPRDYLRSREALGGGIEYHLQDFSVK